MEDFFNKLYSYEFFGFYLIISIIVLVVLFLIILFFGKKDQRNREKEATKKLQQISAEAFKEEVQEEKLEVKEDVLGDTIVVPNIDDVPTLNNVEENVIPEPIIPDSAIEVEKLDIEPIKEEIEEPILEKKEERPFVFENTNVISELNNINEEIKSEPEEIVQPVVEENIPDVPEFNYEEVVKEANVANKSPQIFSSVYVPTKEEEVPVESNSEEMEFELPALKKEPEEPQKEEIEMPALNSYNLEDIAGESYTINK